jgi:hypothetical protein
LSRFHFLSSFYVEKVDKNHKNARVYFDKTSWLMKNAACSENLVFKNQEIGRLNEK